MFNIISLPAVEILIRHYGYILFFLLAIVEGPIVTIIAAFLSSFGYLNVFAVYGVALAGDLVGDVLYYLIGYLGKKRFNSTGKLLGITKENINKITKHFDDHSGKTLLFGKITHSFGFAVLISAGLVNMSIGKFVKYNLLGTIPKALVLVLVGYYFGGAYQSIGSYLDYISLIIFAVIVLLALWYFFIYKQTKE